MIEFRHLHPTDEGHYALRVASGEETLDFIVRPRTASINGMQWEAGILVDGALQRNARGATAEAAFELLVKRFPPVERFMMNLHWMST